MDFNQDENIKLKPIASSYKNLGPDVQAEIKKLVENAVPTKLSSPKVYEFSKVYSSNWNDTVFTVALYPSGVCTIFDQYVYSRDSHGDCHLFGIYKFYEKTVEIDAIFYTSSGGWAPTHYFKEVKKKHFKFERSETEDAIISKINQFDNCDAEMPCLLKMERRLNND